VPLAAITPPYINLSTVRSVGGRVVEAYPNLIEADVSELDAYMGIAHVYAELGFFEVARPRPDKVIMGIRFRRIHELIRRS
jgi:hypothetical protein